MSKNMEADESDLTWKSEKDIIKDLALLNDFGSPGDTEPYKVLYSIGRGIKIKDRKKDQQSFLDSRTGEVINLKDIELDTNSSLKKGHGRGRLLGNFSGTNFQLQEQLRLARPLGSSDEAIESYFRRNRSCEYSTSTDSDPDSQSGRLASKFSSYGPNSDKHKPRVIGSRNSLLQSNVLINNLLCKAKENCNADLTIKPQNKFGDAESEIRAENYYDVNSSTCNGAYCKNDEQSLREATKLGEASDKLRDINTKSSGNITYDLNQKCQLSTQADSDKGMASSNTSDVPYFIKSNADFPPLTTSKRLKF